MKTITLSLFVLVLGVGILHSEPRHALLIGTWDYDDPTYPPLPAKGGGADVAKMKAALTSLGFTVSVVTNPSLKAAKKAVDDFGEVIKKEPGTALFYFTGHGSEYDGKNFLIPKGTAISSNRDLDDEALSANRVLARMEESGGNVNIVFLDCCRNSLSMAGNTGMAPMKAKGTFIGYATRSGKTAQTTVEGSYYTNALVKYLAAPGLSVADMHTRVVNEVKSKDPTQNPGSYSELDQLFYLAGSLQRTQGESAEMKRLREENELLKNGTTKSLPSNPKAGDLLQIILPGGAVMKFCYCPAGTFTMGSPKSEKGRGEDEDQVQVRLSRGFWMAQTECTQSQWASVMSDNPSSFKGSDLPVDSVSWEAAQGFVIKVNKLSGIIPRDHRIALPTEAQWEYACRANTTTAYNFADSASQLHKSANFGDKNLKLFGGRMANKTQDDGVGDTTARVASYRTNNWGLYDMHGNVCEWCADRYESKLRGGTDPIGPTAGTDIPVYRGGCWAMDVQDCRSAHREYSTPDFSDYVMGFRPVLVLSDE